MPSLLLQMLLRRGALSRCRQCTMALLYSPQLGVLPVFSEELQGSVCRGREEQRMLFILFRTQGLPFGCITDPILDPLKADMYLGQTLDGASVLMQEWGSCITTGAMLRSVAWGCGCFFPQSSGEIWQPCCLSKSSSSNLLTLSCVSFEFLHCTL